MSDIREAITNLESVISDKMNYLVNYVKKDNPNEYVVNSINQQIKYLTSVFNFLIELNENINIDLVSKILIQIKDLDKRDSSLAGYDIKLTKVNTKGIFYGQIRHKF